MLQDTVVIFLTANVLDKAEKHHSIQSTKIVCVLIGFNSFSTLNKSTCKKPADIPKVLNLLLST